MARPTKDFRFKVDVELSTRLGRRRHVEPTDFVRVKARSTLGQWLGRMLRDRIRNKGMGAEGALEGYSTKPTRVTNGYLNKRQPPEGLPKVYPGGYKQYREEVGLQTRRFDFTNTSYSLDNFSGDVSGSDPSSSIEVGFHDMRSVMAADSAVARGRSDMFALSDKELDTAAGIYLKYVTEALWAGFFEPGSIKNDTSSEDEAFEEMGN